MAEKDIVYSSSVKYNGIFSFSDFYEFCYNWIESEVEPTVFNEKNYSESIIGNKKVLEIEWEVEKKLTDYFKCLIKIKIKVNIDKKVEVSQGSRKIKAEKGEIKVALKGILVKDYDGRFESSAMLKMWRAIYEKWIISSEVNRLEGKIIGDSEEFLEQAKAFLAIEGKK